MSKKAWIGLGVVAVLLAGTVILAEFTRSTDRFVKIGAILPLTGDAAQYGKACQRGMDLAIEQLNAQDNTNGKALSIVYEDSQAVPATAVSAMNKLIAVDRVKLITGDMFSATTLAIAPIAQREGVVLISPTASAQAVPMTGDHVFSIYPSDAYDGEFLGKSMHKLWPSFSRVAIVYAQAEAMVTCKDAFRAAIEGAGIEITTDDGIPPGTRDLSTVVTRIASGKPQVVLCALYLPEMAVLLKEAATQRLALQFLGISTCYDPKLFDLAGNAAEGLVFSAPFFDVESGDPGVKDFVSAYEFHYGEKPDVWAAYGYDVVRIAAKGIRSSEGEPGSLYSHIASISGFHGATGTTSFNPDGSVTKQMRLLKAVVPSRSFTPVSETGGK